MQAAIGQNRLIFPSRSNWPRRIVTNGKPHRRTSSRDAHQKSGPKDVQEDARRRRKEPKSSCANAQSLWWDNVGRLPPANHLDLFAKLPAKPALAEAWSCVLALPRGLDRKMAHPIDSFDKTDQRTLGTFNSLAGRTDYNASERRSGRREQSAYSGVRQDGAVMVALLAPP